MTATTDPTQPAVPPLAPAPSAPSSAPNAPPAQLAPQPAAPKSLCANCGSELFGPYCYACGQPIKGMIRHLASILHDMLDTIFNIDSRIFRTLFPLYFRPGYLTTEYFAGRRVRYVTPFRLFFFLCIIAIFAIQWNLDSLDLDKDLHVDVYKDDSIASAMTLEEVTARRDAALAQIEKAKTESAISNAATKSLDKAAAAVRGEAEKRLVYLNAVAQAKAKGEALPPDMQEQEGDFIFNGKRWDPQKNPLTVDWLPSSANAKLNQIVGRMAENARRVKKDPKPLLIGAFDALPKVLFVLMPLFAALLKFFYMFKRRLYMEHLIVALHSHSFIFLSLLLLLLGALARNWAHTAAPWLDTLLEWAMFAMGWWLPLYLLIMQKRVYKQGWFFTVFKYCLIGLCYTIMIAFGISAAFVTSLATI